MNALQVTAIATPNETAQGRAPIGLRVLFVLIGVAVVVALQAPITMMAANIIA